MSPLFQRTGRALVALLLSCLVSPWLRAATLELKPDDVIAFVGGANLVTLAQGGALETTLILEHPEKHLRFRNFAWEGDTVFAQPREVNYPDLVTQLREAKATVALVQFGQMESLAGAAGLTNFIAAYGQLLDRLAAVTSSCVLLTPTPYEPGQALDKVKAAERNAVLASYARAIRELAQQRGLAMVDLFTRLTAPSANSRRLIRDGVQLTDAGESEIARLVAGATGAAPTAAGMQRDEIRRILEAVVAKNRLWFRATRPTNWAFLAGDRTDQPFSRDPRDRSVRAFAAEMKLFDPLLADAERRIDELADKVTGKEATR
jgi:lysophospholipase L1-like esterase